MEERDGWEVLLLLTWFGAAGLFRWIWLLVAVFLEDPGWGLWTSRGWDHPKL